MLRLLTHFRHYHQTVITPIIRTLRIAVVLFIGPIPLIDQVQLEEGEIRESRHGVSSPEFRCHETQ